MFDVELHLGRELVTRKSRSVIHQGVEQVFFCIVAIRLCIMSMFCYIFLLLPHVLCMSNMYFYIPVYVCVLYVGMRACFIIHGSPITIMSIHSQTNHYQSPVLCHTLRGAWFFVGCLRVVLFLVCSVLFMIQYYMLRFLLCM